jgi:hypothetical protein
VIAVNILSRIFVSFVVLSSTLMPAQDISGNWQAIISGGLQSDKVRGNKILLHVHKGFDSNWKAVLYSVDRDGGHPLSVTSMTLANFELKFAVPDLNGSFGGTLNADGIGVAGSWSDGGAPRSFDLRRPRVVQRVTVEQLEHMLETHSREGDKKLGHWLAGLQLSERLDTTKLARYEARLRGPDSRQAFLALLDASAFLDPPPSEISTLAEPDIEAQNRMIKLTVDYVVSTIH